MFIESLKIENFKGFHGTHQINLNIPDGTTPGSGLNIFVGENNSGKSTIFEALDFIKDNTKKSPSSLLSRSNPGQELTDFSIEVVYKGQISEVIEAHIQTNKQRTFSDCLFQINGEEGFKVKRSWSQDDPDLIKKIHFWSDSSQDFVNPSGIDAPFKKLYDNNFIWADTNPNDEAKFGASTICGSLLKEIASGHINSSEYQEFLENYHSLFNNPASELRTKISQIESMVQEVFTSQFGVANISFSFDELQIENFFKTANIVIDDGVSVPMSEKGHGMQRAVALSLLQVYAQIASAPDDSSVPKPFYFFIDEPELCLHPLGQKKLLDAFMVISQNRQVFVTTHSPFMLSSPNLVNAGLFICTKTGEVSSVVSANSQPMFPWSPSWGEITYRAYNLATVDLHNELYGYIQEKHTLPRIADVDQWLNGHGVANSKQWTIERNGNPGQTIATTLQSFIRNHIHHPENVTMQSNRYSDSDLQQSIEQMITLL